MHRLSWIALVGALAGCDALAGADYVGQPLFTLTGTFASTATAPGGVALFWQDPSGAGGPGVATTPVPVAIAFPASFRVDVPQPPPAAARFAFSDRPVEIAEAYVYVVDDPAAARLTPRGADRRHALVYASADVDAGTLAADYLGGPLTAGYHLRGFTPLAAGAAPGLGQAALVQRCTNGGAAASACAVRRAYQLAPSADDAPLQIVVAPP